MKKKLLVLGFIIMLSLTACGDNQKFNDEEIKIAKSLVEEFNGSGNEGVVARLDESKRIINFVLEPSLLISDVNGLREAFIEISKVSSDEIENINTKFYYEDDEKNPLLTLKDEKIIKDNMENYVKKHPEKQGEKKKYETEKASFEFLHYKVVDSKEDNGETLFVISMNVTNKGDIEISPWFITTLNIKVMQNDNIYGEEWLSISNELLDESYRTDLKDTDKKIKPGETSKMIMAYKLANLEEPVVIKDAPTEGEDFNVEVEIN